jgi:hypothetical protein
MDRRSLGCGFHVRFFVQCNSFANNGDYSLMWDLFGPYMMIVGSTVAHVTTTHKGVRWTTGVIIIANACWLAYLKGRFAG